jgi:CRISPR-associated protein Cas6
LTRTERIVDLAFPIAGEKIPLDHGYLLYAAVSQLIPKLHDEAGWGIHPIFGERESPGLLRLLPRSLLKVRCPASAVGELLPLVGASLLVGGHGLALGAPRLHPLEPSTALRARYVTIKGFHDDAAAFKDAVVRQIVEMPGLGQEPPSVEVSVGPRRVMRVSDQTVVGFPMLLQGLYAEASILIQTRGIGGRRHLGAGIFVPPGKGQLRPWPQDRRKEKDA